MADTTGSREHQLRLLMLTAGVEGPGQVHSDEPLGEVFTPGGERVEVDLDSAPSGVLQRCPDGSEVLSSLDGYRIELDGHGGVQVWDGAVRLPITGFFYVKP